MTKGSIYYLPGANGRLESGLGEGLTSRGFRVWGRATVGEFKRLSFQEQVDIIAADLQGPLWDPEARVVANSYGGYLFLHAQLQMPSYIGKALLLSPIFGEFSDDKRNQYYVPPRAKRLKQSAGAGTFPSPKDVEIYVGSEDWQTPSHELESFGRLTQIRVVTVPGKGHMLGKNFVGPLLDSWLNGA